MKYIAICYCYSGTGRLIQTSAEGKKSIKEIQFDVPSANKLALRLREILDELNKNAENCFWVIHQVVSIPIQ